MTLKELYARALLRHRKLRDGRFTIGMMRRWLDTLVAEGWLEVVEDRYYLTDKGMEVAVQLDSGLTRGDSLEVSA